MYRNTRKALLALSIACLSASAGAGEGTVAFVGGKIAVFSLVSRSFKCGSSAWDACTSDARREPSSPHVFCWQVLHKRSRRRVRPAAALR